MVNISKEEYERLTKPKRRRAKVYHAKSPDTQIDHAIGKFQHDHPYIAGATEVIVLGPPTAGLIAGILNRFGIRTAGVTNAMKPIPIGGNLYTPAAQIGNAIGDSLRRIF